MTGKDWDNGLRQARTKASNAGGYLQRFQVAYDKVRPLLTDDELTTAAVWPKLDRARVGAQAGGE